MSERNAGQVEGAGPEDQTQGARSDIDGDVTNSRVYTAGRDINDLIGRGALKKDPGGGRSTSYSLVFED